MRRPGRLALRPRVCDPALLLTEAAAADKNVGKLGGQVLYETLGRTLPDGTRGAHVGKANTGYASLGFGIDAGDQFACDNRFAIGLDDLNQNAGIWCRNLENDLVGLDIDQDLVACNGIANLLLPGGQGAFGN